MSGAWTAGPWHVADRTRTGAIHIRDASTPPYPVAEVLEAGGSAALANAALLASAPELADALAELVQAMVDYQADQDDDAPPQHTEMMARARAALAKARGEA